MIRPTQILAGLLAVPLVCATAEAANVLFRDDFNGSTLGAGWTIIRPDSDTYSLTTAPGFFRILTVRGLLGEEGTAKNLLVRPVTGDFIIETRLQFNPRDGQPFAGLLIYQDDAHAVSIGLVYASGERGVFRGVVMLNVGDNVDVTNRPASKYDETNSENPDVIFLRLLRRGDQFVGAYSSDGTSYRELGTVTNALNSLVSVGVGAANGDSAACGPACDVPIPALFDYFQISDVDGGGTTDPGELVSLNIEGPEEVVAGGAGTFQAVARYSDGSTSNVSDVAEWTVAPPDVGTIQDGVFAASNSNSARMATIVASYTQQGEAGNATVTQAILIRVNPNGSIGPVRLCGAGLMPLLPVVLLPFCLRGVRQ